jgi:hypothetical protein
VPVVTKLADDGTAGTLRFEVAQPPPVTFAAGLTGVINLTQGEITIPNGQSINGAGAAVTVNGMGLDRIFHVPPGNSAAVSNLTLANGFARLTGLVGPTTGFGGAILNEGNLYVQGVTFNYNRAHWSGGAIQTPAGGNATLAVDTCSFTANQALFGFGGALSTNDPSRREGGALYVSVWESTFVANVADRGGGAIDFDPPPYAFGTAVLEVVHSTFRGNQAADGGGLHSRDTAQTTGAEYIYLYGNSFDGNGARGALTTAGGTGYGGAVHLAMLLGGTAAAYAWVIGGDFNQGYTTGFTGNWANYGGALSTVVQTSGNSLADVQIEQVEVSFNRAVWGGGIYQDLNGGSTDPAGAAGTRSSIALRYSTVSDNVASSLPVGGSALDGKGGGIYARVSGNLNTLLWYVNDTVAYNSAVTSASGASRGDGGGVYLAGANLSPAGLVFHVWLNCLTVAYNRAVNNGGGLYVENPPPGVPPALLPELRNCAFCSNVALVAGQDGLATVLSNGYNQASNPAGIIGLTLLTDILSMPCNLNPALANNGGPTLTLWPEPVLPTLRGKGWPAPGAGDLPDDQRYVLRFSRTTIGAVDPGPGNTWSGGAGDDGPPPGPGAADPSVVAALTGKRRDGAFPLGPGEP